MRLSVCLSPAQNYSKLEARFSSGGVSLSAIATTEINQETTMNKTLLSLAAVASIAVSLLAAPPAEARCWGCAVGVDVAAGVVTGAIVGSVIANSYGPAYAVQPGYTAYPAYAAAGPVACPSEIDTKLKQLQTCRG